MTRDPWGHEAVGEQRLNPSRLPVPFLLRGLPCYSSCITCPNPSALMGRVHGQHSGGIREETLSLARAIRLRLGHPPGVPVHEFSNGKWWLSLQQLEPLVPIGHVFCMVTETVFAAHFHGQACVCAECGRCGAPEGGRCVSPRSVSCPVSVVSR